MPDPSSANRSVSERSDAPMTTATPYEISAGSTFSGGLTAGDRDWVAITLAPGERIEVNLTGISLTDPYLRIHGANGALIRDNDDSGSSDSRLLFGSAQGGTFYLSAGSSGDTGGGRYRLAVTPHVPEVYNWNRIADYLTDGYFATDGNRQGRAFDVSAATGSNGTLTYDVSGLAANTAQGRMGRQHVEWALDAWSAITGITFVRTNSTKADIRFDDNRNGANNGSTTTGDGVILQSRVDIGGNFLPSDNVARIDSYLMQTYLHKIGHALGLGHAGPYDGNGKFDSDILYLNDSWHSTVMSYISQGQNTFVDASHAYVTGPQIADILAIQNIYGTPTDTRRGDTVYGQNSTAGGYLDAIGDTRTSWTIFDSAGTDTIDYSGDYRDQVYDLRGGFFSSVMGERGNIGIAIGTVIENVRAGRGDDRIGGNGTDNRLEGGGGDDIVRGYTGNDTLLGGGGNDALIGGYGRDLIGGDAGDDRISGGTGDDGLYGGYGNDLLQGGAGNDTLSGSVGSDTLSGDGGNDHLSGGVWGDVLSGGAGNDTLIGDAGQDRLFGGTGSDLIGGEDGNDIIVGGQGADRLYGGRGADTFIYNAVSESAAGAADRIVGMNSADVIDLRVIDANAVRGGSQAFTFVGTGGYRAAGDLRFATDGTDGYLLGDVDGDGAHDLVIALAGVTRFSSDNILL